MADLIDIARSLEPLIREHAEVLEEGHVPPPLIEALYDAGVFSAMLPREVGGLEAEPVEWLRMIEEFARINASVGWMAFIQSGVGLTFLDPRAVRALPGPRRRALDPRDEPRPGGRESGQGRGRLPHQRPVAEQVNPGFYSAPVYDRALFRMKEMPEVGHGAHALGVASGALESFVDAVNTKPVPGSTRHLAMGHMQAHQIAFARADALVRAARALLHETVRAAYEDATAHAELTLELRVRLREANVFAVRAAKEAVGLIFEMAGSSAVYRGRAIEQAFRDINTAANHTNYVETAYAAIGSYFLTRDRAGGPEIAGRPSL